MKKRAGVPEIACHGIVDWCHLCGIRRETADVWYPVNAEHDKMNAKYIRICAGCADDIGAAAREKTEQRPGDTRKRA